MHDIAAMKAPLVSVVMPVYNAGPYVAAAIRSVLAQTMNDWELIVIDDRSTDDSCQKVMQIAENDPRIIVCRNEENLGVAKTRNRGIQKCRGQYVAFLDSDDTWHPDKLRQQLEKMSAEKADVVYCSAAIVGTSDEKVRADYIVPERIDFEGLLKENVITCSSMLIRTEILREIAFNPEYFHEDYVLSLDILSAGYKAVGCTDVLMNWRYMGDSRSFNKIKSAWNRWLVYREHLKLSVARSSMLFMHYSLAGVKKYGRRKQV